MKAVFRFLWNTIKVFNTLAGFLLLIIVFVTISALSSRETRPVIHDETALVFAPEGVLVENRRIPTLDDLLAGEGAVKEVVLREALAALEHAATDTRIKMLVLDLDQFAGGGPAALFTLADAIDAFRESKKPVVAIGDSFDQGQYFLAAHADEIWMHPYGAVSLVGFGSFVPHFAAALDKIDLDVRVFRVGTFKSAVEPWMRDDMSDEAKEANRAFLGTLWSSYMERVEARRGLAGGAITGTIDDILARSRAAGGDQAKMALNEGWVDALLDHEAMQDQLAAMQTDDGDEDFRQIDLPTYMAAAGLAADSHGSGKDVIAVVTLAGEIVDGEGDFGQIGSESTVSLIERARDSTSVKALVLRVDSPGGSLFASEEIRSALADFQATDRPLVVSMGSVAASGGYWISAMADEIWAAPETITGSIGVFALFPSLAGTLDRIGIHYDGVGTTPLAGAFNPLMGLSDTAASLIQAGVEDSYGKFLDLVADGRGMTPEAVDAIAQGRVWAGVTAHELGLVDHLGGLGEAIAAAATRAELAEGRFSVRYLSREISDLENFVLRLMQSTEARGFALHRIFSRPALPAPLGDIAAAAARLPTLADRDGRFVLCLVCELR